MFDGLDEVNDCKQQAIQLIVALNRVCKLKKIIITTRNHLTEELEDRISTFLFNLKNFDEEDKKNYLNNTSKRMKRSKCNQWKV